MYQPAAKRMKAVENCDAVPWVTARLTDMPMRFYRNPGPVNLSFRLKSVFQSFAEGTVSQVLQNSHVKFGNDAGRMDFSREPLVTAETPTYALPDISYSVEMQTSIKPEIASVEVYATLGYVITDGKVNEEAFMSLLDNFTRALLPTYANVPLFINIELVQQEPPEGCRFVQPIFEAVREKVNLRRLSFTANAMHKDHQDIRRLLHRLLSIGRETLEFVTVHPSRLLVSALQQNCGLVFPNVKHLRIHNADEITSIDMALLASGFPNIDQLTWFSHEIRWQDFWRFPSLKHASIHGAQSGSGCENSQLPSLSYDTHGMGFGSRDVLSMLRNPHLNYLRLSLGERDLAEAAISLAIDDHALPHTLKELDLRVMISGRVYDTEFTDPIAAAFFFSVGLVDCLPSVNMFNLAICHDAVVFGETPFEGLMNLLPEHVTVFGLEFVTSPEDLRSGITELQLKNIVTTLLLSAAQATHLDEAVFTVHWSGQTMIEWTRSVDNNRQRILNFARRISVTPEWLLQWCDASGIGSIQRVAVSEHHWASNRPTRYFENQTVEWPHCDITVVFLNGHSRKHQKFTIRMDIQEYAPVGNLEWCVCPS